ncbi:MAG TPA: hypothetical protein VGQ02_10680 [Candidatus Limnocylindrales bacterium]|nr:hypothetical protein [Candidatus Limnocylindrales bacterium]
MSTDREVTRIVRSWLEEGVTALPDRVLDDVLDQLPTTPQRRAWWPARRFRQMNIPIRVAVAVAAVVVVAVAGIYVLPRTGGVGGPSPSPTPTPSPAPSASPMALRHDALPAGTYLVNPSSDPTWTACPQPTTLGCSDPDAADTIRFTMTVPEGWAGVGYSAIWLASEQAAPPGGASVGFHRGNWLHSDPCRPDAALPATKVGPTVDDFANALADHPLLEVTTPVDVVLAGYSGKYVDLQVPSDISGCPTSYFPWEPGIYAQGPSQRWHLWILDVNGVRVVVQSTDYAGTSPQRRAELQAIVNSIRIEP